MQTWTKKESRYTKGHLAFGLFSLVLLLVAAWSHADFSREAPIIPTNNLKDTRTYLAIPQKQSTSFVIAEPISSAVSQATVDDSQTVNVASQQTKPQAETQSHTETDTVLLQVQKNPNCISMLVLSVCKL